MKPVPIGQLDQRITLQSRSLAKSGTGQDTVTWSALATVWARVEHIGGKELLARYGIDAEQSVRFTIRRRNDLSAVNRISYQGQVYDIKALPPFQNRDDYIQIITTQGLTNG